jgi:glycosyltransferase involved in cell wall biosynthesis
MHLVIAGDIGGAERFLVELASRPCLSRASHLIALISPNPRLSEFFQQAGLEVIFRPCRFEGGLAYLWRTFGPREVMWLGQLVRKHRVDLLHLHTFASHLLGVRAALACGIPVLRTEHGVRHYGDLTCAIYRHWTLRNTTRIAAVSEFVASVVLRTEPGLSNRVSVVHNGVDTALYRPVETQPKGFMVALILSRLEAVKRVDLVISAMPLVPGVRLRIAGEGSCKAALAGLAKRLGVSDRIEFLGYKADPSQVIAEADILVNCTREEGLGLSVLEAASMQRPAIAFAGGGIPEVVVDGLSGWLFREGSAEALAAVLNKVAGDREALTRRGLEARKRVERHFTVEAMCEKYGAIYSQLIPGADADV